MWVCGGRIGFVEKSEVLIFRSKKEDLWANIGGDGWELIWRGA